MLVRAMENVKAAMPGLSLEDRFRRALRGGGMAVLATSVANVAAFLFGSITTIPAIRWCAFDGLRVASALQSSLVKPAAFVLPTLGRLNQGTGLTNPS
jgi:Patched family